MYDGPNGPLFLLSFEFGASNNTRANANGPIHQLGSNLCTYISIIKFNQSRPPMSKLNWANNLACNIKPLGPIDGPIEAFEQSYWLIFKVVELSQQPGPNIKWA